MEPVPKGPRFLVSTRSLGSSGTANGCQNVARLIEAKTAIQDFSKNLDAGKNQIHSTTGELTWDYGVGLCTINAPKAQGVTGFLKNGGTIKCADVEIESGNDYATVLVVAMDDLHRAVVEEKLVPGGDPFRVAQGIDVCAVAASEFLARAAATGAVLSAMDPNYVGALTLMLLPNTELGQKERSGQFELMTPPELLAELREMLLHTNLRQGLFLSNHASNYLPLKVRMPAGKAEALALIDEALGGRVRLKPEWLRAL